MDNEQIRADAQELDLWRFQEAARMYIRNGFSPFWNYRSLVRDDVRPNTVPVFPKAVEHAVSEIKASMNELDVENLFRLLPNIILEVYETAQQDDVRTQNGNRDGQLKAQYAEAQRSEEKSPLADYRNYTNPARETRLGETATWDYGIHDTPIGAGLAERYPV